MKKQVFIIVGALIILSLILVWAYLLFVGTPKSADEVFSELGLSGSEEGNIYIAPAEVVEESSLINMERPKLRQLTTKPVAGFREINLSTTTPAKLTYVEKGTGHVYSINLESGEEIRLSGTTVAQAYKAAISPQGNFVAISTLGNTKNMPLVLGELSTSSESFSEKFTAVTTDFSFSENNELLFTTSNSQGLTGNAFNLKNNVRKDIFSLPFHEATILWGERGNDVHYAFPKSAFALEGALYEVSVSKLTRLPLAGFGFGAKINDDVIIYNSNQNQKTTSYIYDRQTKATKSLESPILLEKCFLPTSGFIFVCGFEPIKVAAELPDAWYKGEVSFKDSLLALSASAFVSEELVNTFTESGREIDITNIVMNETRTAIYFNNKNDNSLWMYEI